MSKLTRDLYGPYIDLDRGANAVASKYKLGRVRKSTIFEFSANAQEDTFGYIDSPNDTTTVTSYQPNLPLETITESTDPIARFAQEYLFEFPLGADTEVPFVLAYPLIDEGGAISETQCNVIIWDEAVMSNLALNTVDQKFTWTEMLNGNPKRGVVDITAFATDSTGTAIDFTLAPAEVTPPSSGEDQGGGSGSETPAVLSSRSKSK